MITRRPSKIIDSVVNSAHEEHFNVVKAIRDNAPVTDLTTVVKSVNFISEGDGSYVLRKPLVKKTSLSLTQTLLYDSKSILYFDNGNLYISYDSSEVVIFRWYDDNLELHEIRHYGGIPNASNWMEINKIYQVLDHTILNVDIDHKAFIVAMQGVTPDNENCEWLLTKDEYNGYNFIHNPTLKRFVKVYRTTDTNEFVVEIVNPELNSITSSLDSDNAESLDINLLLDNPYAIRDLYNYGYVSCTKIIPYIGFGGNHYLNASEVYQKKIWEITEAKPYGAMEQYGFKIINSLNPKDVNMQNTCLVLKAFLTTKKTPLGYYCCWEYSNDEGITWRTCPEFLEKYQNSIVTKKIVDLTSADFDNIANNESLDKANNYLVDKQLVSMSLSDGYSPDDLAMDRPDVLVIPFSKCNYLYRFRIYLYTPKPTPTPKEVTKTCSLMNFSGISGTFPTQGTETISYTGQTIVGANNTPNGFSSKVEDGKLVIPIGTYVTGVGSSSDPKRQSVGTVLNIHASSPCKLKSVKIYLCPKQYNSENNRDEYIGACIGNAPIYTTRYEEFPLNSLTLKHNLGYYYYKADAKNLWVMNGQSVEFSVDNASETFIYNLSNWLRDEYANSNQDYNFNDLKSVYAGATTTFQCFMKINKIEVVYTTLEQVEFSSTYLISATGAFSFVQEAVRPLTVVENLDVIRNRLFAGEMYYNDKQAQALIYKDRYLFISGTNSTIFKTLNSLNIPEEIIKIIPWRGYFLFFSAKAIYLARYEASSDSYTYKVLSNTVGVSKIDADTIVPILNSIYFKSGNKVYKLVPNLYAASDDILNIHQVSDGVNNILENLTNEFIETHNFGYSDADMYYIFIPDTANEVTYGLIYDFNKHLWNFVKYNTVLTDVYKVSVTEAYLIDSEQSPNFYHFKESLKTLLSKGLKQWCEDNNENEDDYDLDIIFNAVPYCDYLEHTPKEIIPLAIANVSAGGSFEDAFAHAKRPIYFEIDFGQKSSNYTLYKQFLETKITLATLSSKDTFPVDLEILTDGISRHLHIDSNTDGALWKTSLDQVGTLNTHFNFEGQDFNGIMRQLIVKYSGKGKSIRHIISGTSKSLFKFYSMDVRARILPKKM